MVCLINLDLLIVESKSTIYDEQDRYISEKIGGYLIKSIAKEFDSIYN